MKSRLKYYYNFNPTNLRKVFLLALMAVSTTIGTFTIANLVEAEDYTVEYIAPATYSSNENHLVPVMVDANTVEYVPENQPETLTDTIQPKVKTYEEYLQSQQTKQQTNKEETLQPHTEQTTQDNLKQVTQETIQTSQKNLTQMQQANVNFALCLRKYGIETPSNLHSVSKYADLIEYYAAKNSSKYTIPTLMVECMSLQESNDNPMASNGHAGGLLQIEDTNLKDFKDYSIATYNEYWVSQDRFHVEKNIDYACHKVAILLDLYEGDYVKALQAYNYSQFSLNKLINVYGDDWFTNRSQMARLNNCSSYGDPKYVEHVASKLSV